jgi:hypothetical protein
VFASTDSHPNAREGDLEGVERAPSVPPRRDGPLTDVLDQLEHLVAGLRAHDVAQHPAEEPDVVAECCVLGFPEFLMCRAGVGRHGS